MAVPSSSSSPFSETEAKPYPHQQFKDNGANGPKGAYEARKVEGGLHVRVDMPGVPPDNVKVFKNSEQRTVTFTGKTLKKLAKEKDVWAELNDLSYRVYGGYVALDRDPAEVEVKYEVKDGCLRLFFPNCDGSLHFLSPPARGHHGGESDSPSDLSSSGQEEETGSDGLPAIVIEHAIEEDLGLRLRGGKEEHINPYVLSGPKAVYEHKILKEVDGRQVYVRLDVPGGLEIAYGILEKDRCVMASVLGPKESPFDEGVREYYFVLNPGCPCCIYSVVKYELKNGVLRFLVRWAPYLHQAKPVVHCLLPPHRRGEPARPSTLDLCFVNEEMRASQGTPR